MVDDGSTDDTLKVLCRVAHQYDGALRIYSIDNGGVSRARNFGIDHAAGDWITFVDADDVVETEFASSLSNLRGRHDIEIIRYSFVRDNTHRVMCCRFISKTTTYDQPAIVGIVEAMLGLSRREREHPAPSFFWLRFCGVVYSRRLIQSHNLRFNESPFDDGGLHFSHRSTFVL